MKYLHFTLLIILLISWNSDVKSQDFDSEMENDFSKCPHGVIPAIFDKDTSNLVISQDYVMTKGSATETVVFENGTSLTLYQTGCKVLKQNYSFRLLKTPKEENPKTWIALAINQFDYMAKVDEDFGILTGLIEENAEEMELGKPIQEEDYTLTVDKSSEGEVTVLVVSFDLFYPE